MPTDIQSKYLHFRHFRIKRQHTDTTGCEPSTTSHSHAWTVFRNFAEKFGLCIQLPVKQHIFVYYVAYLFSRDFAVSTNTSYLSVVSYIHKLPNLHDPCSSFLIQILLCSTCKLKPSQDIRIPIIKHILHKRGLGREYGGQIVHKSIMF